MTSFYYFILIALVIISISASSFLSLSTINQRFGFYVTYAQSTSEPLKKLTKSYKRWIIVLNLITLIGCSIGLFATRFVQDAILLISILVYTFAMFIIYWIFQNKTLEYKKTTDQPYPASAMQADLQVLSKYGSYGISSRWNWILILLSFAPLLFKHFYPKLPGNISLPLLLIGPFIQIICLLGFYGSKRFIAKTISNDSCDNQAYAKQFSINNTLFALQMSLLICSFFLLFYGALFTSSTILVLAAVVMLVPGLFILSFIHIQKQNSLNIQFHTEENPEPLSHYKWGIYYNPDDPRVFVPKKIQGLGATINMGNRKGKAAASALALVICSVLMLLFISDQKNYAYSITDTTFEIDAGMYDTTVDYDAILSIQTVDELPTGMRINGFSGLSKQYGYFRLDGYGKVHLYIYMNSEVYIVIQTENSSIPYIILNDKTPEKTRELYLKLETIVNP